MKFNAAGMYFESESTSTKKKFKISFPYDLLFTIKWDEKKELPKLQKLDKSEKVSDQLKMLAMIAEKAEARAGETVKETK